jgi:integrase
MATPAFNDALVRALKPSAARQKLTDPESRGLYVLAMPNGTKIWRLRLQREGETTEKTLGHFPDMGVVHARAAAEVARGEKYDVPFRLAADEWLAWWSINKAPVTIRAAKHRLRDHVLPALGDKGIGTITAREVLDVADASRKAGNFHTGTRCVQIMRQVFALAAARHGLTFNPAREVAEVGLPSPPTTHQKAPTMAQLGALMRMLETYGGQDTANALRLLIYTAARTGEVRFADWSEFRDLNKPAEAVWIVPAARMKMRRPHAVPLSRQALAILKAQAGKEWPKAGLVFPGPKEKALSENAFLSLLYKRELKGAYTIHGIRAAFSTAANLAGMDAASIEAALAHRVGSTVSATYNRATYDGPRRKLMQWWSDRVGEELRKAKDQERVAELLG